MDKQAAVREFMEAVGQTNPTKPVLLDKKVSKLRFDLIMEELIEYHDAMRDKSLVDIADALGDLLYVVYGAAVAHGIDIEPIFKEIHRSNMTKVIDGSKRESDGKWMKGPSFQKPQLKPIINKQLGD